MYKWGSNISIFGFSNWYFVGFSFIIGRGCGGNSGNLRKFLCGLFDCERGRDVVGAKESEIGIEKMFWEKWGDI